MLELEWTTLPASDLVELVTEEQHHPPAGQVDSLLQLLPQPVGLLLLLLVLQDGDVPVERYSPALNFTALLLVESFIVPALLCHKEPATGTKCPYVVRGFGA